MRMIVPLVLIVGLFALASHAEPPVEPKGVKPSPVVEKLEEAAKENVALKAENAALTKQLATLSVQANGLLRKVGTLAAEKTLLELEVDRLASELEAARKGK